MENTPTNLTVREFSMLNMEVQNKHLYRAVLQILKNKGIVSPTTRLRFSKAIDASDSGTVQVFENRVVITLRMLNFGAFTQLVVSSEIELLEDNDPETQEYYGVMVIKEVLEILNRESVSLT